MRILRRPCPWALPVALVVAAGCGGGGGTAARDEWRDPHPLPADTQRVDVPAPGVHGGRFVLGQTSSPKTFNGMMSNESSSSDVNNLLYASLVDWDYRTRQVTGMLAKSWSMSPDGREWTFRLRRGARFSDGVPITSADVTFSFAVAYDTTLHPSVQDLLKPDGRPFEVTAPDSYTVVVRSARPYRTFLYWISALRVMPRHVLEARWRAGEFASAFGVDTAPESLVTSGAWRLKSFLPGERTVVTRNPWWFRVDPRGRRLPYLDEVVFVIVPDQEAAALRFRAGELDALDNVKPEDYRAYEADQARAGFVLYDLGPALSTNFLWFNLNRVREPRPGRRVGEPAVGAVPYAWFREARFRRAVSMAIDRDAIIAACYHGEAVKNWSTTTAGNRRWHMPDITGPDHDPEGARRLLAGLGFRDRDGDGVLEDAGGHPVRFTLRTNADNRVRVAMANFVRDDLAKVGLEVTVTPVDFNTLMTNFRGDFDYEAALLGLQGGVPPDPAMSANVFRSRGATHWWHVRQPAPGTAAEARIDSLVEANIATFDEAVMDRTWREIQTVINDEVFLVWLPTQKVRIPVRDRFGNVQPSVIPHRLLWNIEWVWARPAGRPA